MAHPNAGRLLPDRTPVVIARSPGFVGPAFPTRILGATVGWSRNDDVILSSSPGTVLSGPDVAVVGDDESDPEPAQVRTFAERFLEVANETNETVTVYVQYRSAKNGSFAWAPADPRNSKEAVSFQLEPGQKTQINHDDVIVRASKVRIWAEGVNGGRWNQHQSRDLWLVPETNDQGQHVYQAVDMEAQTYVIR